MKKTESHLEDLKEIRSLMERSSRFISLSGLSGVAAGVCGLAAAFVTHWYLEKEGLRNTFTRTGYISLELEHKVIGNLLLIGCITLLLAVSAATFFTVRKANRHGDRLWDSTSKKLMINILLPLLTGGVFCFALLHHGEYGLVAPATLLFYGLALLNGSKYTLDELRYLGISQIVLGLIASFFVGYGLEFWAMGFGILHIFYGLSMWYKYDRKA